MSRSFVVVAIAVVVLSAPALLACEKCVPKGSLDPNGGGPYGSAICWTIASGMMSYCWGGPTTCSGDDPENSCPSGGGGDQCVTMPSGDVVCVYNVDPIISDPEGPCRATDVQGRCAKRVTRTASLLR